MLARSILPALIAAIAIGLFHWPAPARSAEDRVLHNLQDAGEHSPSAEETHATDEQETRAVAAEKRKPKPVSNVMKTKHDTAKASINNVR